VDRLNHLARKCRCIEGVNAADCKCSINTGSNVVQESDMDRLDHLARDCEALTKELHSARSHLANAHKDKHQVQRRGPAVGAAVASGCDDDARMHGLCPPVRKLANAALSECLSVLQGRAGAAPHERCCALPAAFSQSPTLHSSGLLVSARRRCRSR